MNPSLHGEYQNPCILAHEQGLSERLRLKWSRLGPRGHGREVKRQPRTVSRSDRFFETTRFLPLRLASYRASSARRMTSVSSSPAASSVTPQLTVNFTVPLRPSASYS